MWTPVDLHTGSSDWYLGLSWITLSRGIISDIRHHFYAEISGAIETCSVLIVTLSSAVIYGALNL